MQSVVIVDDDRLVRESLAEVLAELGLQPVCLGSAAEALALLRRQPCDLLVSDVDMPDASGFALIERLHRLGLGPPFILMSARCQPDLAGEARRLGALDFIDKPVALDSFTRSVRQAIHL